METYNKHIAGNNKVEFIHVSMDEDKKDALKWAASASLPWLHVLNSKAKSTGLLAYDQGGVPQYHLISKDGEVLATGKGAAMKKIDELTK